MKKVATNWEVKVNGKKRSIQLFDAEGNKLKGSEASWEGNFYCYNNQLTTLEGAPSEVGGNFYCYNNQLTTLEGAPSEVGGGFYCYGNQLTTLEGAPSEVGGGFDCYGNQLTTLEGAPSEVGGDFYCYGNQLTTLEGAPSEVGGGFYCSNNQLRPNEKIPAQNSSAVLPRIFKRKLKKGYILADGILLKLVSKKGHILKGRKLGSREVVYVAHKKNTYAHGTTAREASDELLFKLGKRDVSQFKKWGLDKKVTLAEMRLAYRAITGACQYGVGEFVKALPKKKRSYTVAEVITLTEGRYGHNTFKGFEWKR